MGGSCQIVRNSLPWKVFGRENLAGTTFAPPTHAVGVEDHHIGTFNSNRLSPTRRPNAKRNLIEFSATALVAARQFGTISGVKVRIP